MTTLATRLAELEIDPTLYDAVSGKPIGDDAAEYAVLSETRVGGYLYLAVRGPSGQIDVADLSDGCCLRRDAITDAAELTAAI